ncbi:putative fungal-specific transcription factor [Rhodocollybia butyracea]|uniref:Fungal-specific transcription factor n=1 Tax=Rhodocollybia butyracea TaxID=206335 RepID=A0A9P5Q4W3_9AGAR|nr:putative fungal-specific transcription factor [Rhodocollybia butyracea]
MNKHSTSTSENTSAKRRRLAGACDLCKRRKIRCDSGVKAGSPCTNCLQANSDCTHAELTKNLGSAKGYVESLEQKLDKMQTLLSKLLPGVDIAAELENGIDCPHDEVDELPRNDTTLINEFENLKLDSNKKRFFGRSSGLYLVETALQHKNHHASLPSTVDVKRPLACDPEDWQLRYLQDPTPHYEFPEDDLMTSLIDLYFENVNLLLPLLHRPTFMNAIAEDLHLSNTFFGASVLLVCALGSRHSDDPRAFSEGPSVPSSAGWQWYVQVPMIRTHLQLSKPTLHEIQCYALSVVYIKATTVSQSTWIQIGFGLRLSQDVGAHRARNPSGPTMSDELWKRAFFVLLTLERTIGSFAGRPATIHEEEYDVELPIDCDDEYWEHPDPDMAFKQPPRTPSKLSFFIHYLKLMDILAYAMRTIYPIRQTRLFTRPRIYSTQQLIANLDSLLNQWLDAVPEHLKWDPKRRGPFFRQSALIYSNYYNMQCFIHRPFIPMPRNPSSLSFPSLTICVTSARACGRVAKAMVEQDVILPLPHTWMCFFTSAVVLLLSTWTGRRSGIASASAHSDAMEGVDACLQTFKMCESRWPASGRLWDMITDMAQVGETYPTPNNKRPRSIEYLRPQEEVNNTSNEQRQIAGSYRILRAARTYMNGSHNIGPDADLRNEAAQNLDFSSFLKFPEGSSSMPEEPVPVFDTPTFLDTSSAPLPDLPAMGSLGADQPLLSQADVDFDNFLSSLPSMDSATMAIWSATPVGYEVDDWNMYLSNLQGAGVLDGTEQ